MRYKLLGNSGLRVSELCLGTMTFGETWGWGASKQESRRQFDLFLEAGGNFMDTSVNYSDGTSETFLGEFIQEKRQSLVIATKYSLTRPDSADPNSGGNSRKNMVQSIECSLKRLGTEYVDLLYLHMWDYMTPVEEVLRGLDDLVRAGKVLYVAISDSPAWILAEANARAELMGWSRFVGLQVPYSLLSRAVERDVLPAAKHWDMAVLTWGILESGILTGKFMGDVQGETRLNPEKLKLRDRHVQIVQEVQRIAQETGRSMAQVALNWVRQQQAKAQIIPILGARSAAQLQDNLGVLAWSLTGEQLDRLDEVSQIDLGFPHDLLPGNPYLFGSTFDLIDNHRE